MEPVTCTHCGGAIEGEGIRHRRWVFCSDECCETFEEGFLTHGEPDAADLEEDDTDDVFEEDFFDADGEDEDGLDDDLDDDDF